MFGAIQRVISGENMDKEGQQEPSPEAPNNHNSMDRSDAPMPFATTSGNVAALVESDDNYDNNGDVDMGENSTAGSSISDVSAAKEYLQQQQQQQHHQHQQNHLHEPMIIVEEDISKPPPVPASTSATNRSGSNMASSIPRSNLSRTDSRNSTDSFSSYGRQSSQNSSRDWGWFEDVHITDLAGTGAGTTAAGTTQPGSSLKRTKHGSSGNGSDANNYSPTTHKAREKSKKKGKRGNSGGKSGGGYGTPLLPNIALMPGDDILADGSREILLHPSTDMETEARAMAVTAPNYVLEESLSSQRLWKDTAGNRPPQPVEERAFFEKMWAQNFARSQVEYKMPVEVLTATTPISLSPFADGNFDTTAKEISNYNLAVPPSSDAATHHTGVSGTAGHNQDVAEATLVSRLNDPRGGHSVVSGISGSSQSHHFQSHEVVNRKVKGSGSDGDLTVLIKGDNVFGTTVSKSFARPSEYGGPISGVDTVNISIASYRVVESKKHGKYAQFLVIYREGSIRDTIGVWKRYSDFQRLSEKVTKAHEGCAAVIANMSPLAVTEEHDVEHLPNAITSWRLLKKRQRWYRCLDAGYLSLKVFLLERFLHDILFESSTPNLLRDFVRGD